MSGVITRSKRLESLGTSGGTDLYRFRPRLFSYFVPGTRKLNLRSFVRMTVTLLLEGYDAYYMCQNGNVVGCAVITRGGGRMKCSDSADIVIGPYWIEPEYRGLGYGKKLVHAVLHECGLGYENAYAFVQKTNIPSIKTLEHEGFVNVGEAGIEKYTHRWILSASGGDYIYRLTCDRGKE